MNFSEIRLIITRHGEHIFIYLRYLSSITLLKTENAC